MKRSSAILSAALLWFLCWGAGAPVQAKVFDRIVAIVNDDIITLSELNLAGKPIFEKIKQDAYNPNQEELLKEARLQVLNALVDSKITEQEAKKWGITVTEEEVDAFLKQLMQDYSMTEEQMRLAAKQEGITWKEYRKKLADQLIKMNLLEAEVRGKTVITEAQLKEYYEQHLDDYKGAEQVHLAQILLSLPEGATSEQKARRWQEAQKILLELVAGADFAELAKKYSDAPSAEDGGDLGSFETEKLAPFLRQITEQLRPGQISGVVETPDGLQIIKVLAREAQSIKSLEEVKGEIRQRLFQKEVDARYSSWLKELRSRAFIKILL